MVYIIVGCFFVRSISIPKADKRYIPPHPHPTFCDQIVVILVILLPFGVSGFKDSPIKC